MEATEKVQISAGTPTETKPSVVCSRCHCYQIKPEIPMYAPYNIHLTPGKTYLWCTCGKSKSQPFCDKSHKGTQFKPLAFSVDKEQNRHSLCGCKYTRSPPFCNGDHGPMPADPDVPPCRCDKALSW